MAWTGTLLSCVSLNFSQNQWLFSDSFISTDIYSALQFVVPSSFTFLISSQSRVLEESDAWFSWSSINSLKLSCTTRAICYWLIIPFICATRRALCHYRNLNDWLTICCCCCCWVESNDDVIEWHMNWELRWRKQNYFIYRMHSIIMKRRGLSSQWLKTSHNIGVVRLYFARVTAMPTRVTTAVIMFLMKFLVKTPATCFT
jgi:hypothetical protein